MSRKYQVWPIGRPCHSPSGAGQWLSLGALAPSNRVRCALQVIALNAGLLNLLSTPADGEAGAPGILLLHLTILL